MFNIIFAHWFISVYDTGKKVENALCVIGFRYRKNASLCDAIEKVVQDVNQLTKLAANTCNVLKRKCENMERDLKRQKRIAKSYEQQVGYLKQRNDELSSSLLSVSFVESEDDNDNN